MTSGMDAFWSTHAAGAYVRVHAAQPSAKHDPNTMGRTRIVLAISPASGDGPEGNNLSLSRLEFGVWVCGKQGPFFAVNAHRLP